MFDSFVEATYSQEEVFILTHSATSKNRRLFCRKIRKGPITFDINLRTRKVEWYLKKEGICTLAQKLYDNADLFKGHFEAAKAEILHLICELDSDSLRAILKIEEPQTFKIGENDLLGEILKKIGTA
jgi:hypothetical protein